MKNNLIIDDISKRIGALTRSAKLDEDERAELAEIGKQLELVSEDKVICATGLHAEEIPEENDAYSREKRISNILELLDAKGSYTLAPDVYRMFNQCIRILMKIADCDKNIVEVLSIIGGKFELTRSGVFIKEDDGTFSCEMEWTKDGVESRASFYQRMDFEREMPGFLTSLRQDGMISASNIADLPDDISRSFKNKGVKSLAIFPMEENGEFMGFIFFSNCESYRLWPLEKLLMLHNITMIIANLIAKNQLQIALETANQKMLDIFDNMEIPIYVSDIETDLLLFSNKPARQLYAGASGPDSKHCWEIIRGETERCKDCKLDRLLANPEQTRYVWEIFDEHNHCHYKVHDSLIPWTGGQQAHLQYEVDITAIKEYQNRLEHVASTDAFTGTLNRGSLMPGLRDLFARADEINQPVTLCFVDIDRLKYTNDTFGHSCGDSLIIRVVEKLKGCVRKDDIIGRYGGDEFIVALMKCDGKVAEQKISAARRQLIHESRDNEIKLCFSYGIVQNTELDYADSDAYVEKLLEIADKRMLAFKQEIYGKCSTSR